MSSASREHLFEAKVERTAHVGESDTTNMAEGRMRKHGSSLDKILLRVFCMPQDMQPLGFRKTYIGDWHGRAVVLLGVSG